MNYDIIIPVGPNDIKNIDNHVNNIKKYVLGYNKIYIISAENPKIVDCEFIDESIFDFKNMIQELRRNWYYQQLIKLLIYKYTPQVSENYLTIDADMFFTTPIYPFDLNGKTIFGLGTENHTPYFDHMKKLHPDLTKEITESAICHHMLFNKRIIQEMVSKIENHHKKNFMTVFLENLVPDEISGASEYEMYFTHFLKNYKENVSLRFDNWYNVDICVLNPDRTDGLFAVAMHDYLKRDMSFFRKYETDFCFVLVHYSSNNFIPNYIYHCIKQIRVHNSRPLIYLLTNCKNLFNLHTLYSFGVNVVDCNQIPLTEEHIYYNEHTKLDKKWRDGWANYTCERYFAIYDFAKHKNITNMIHIENDVMIYYNMNGIIDTMKKYDFLAPLDSVVKNFRCVPSLLFIKNSEVIHEFVKYVNTTLSEHIYDMFLLGNYFQKRKIENLPTTYNGIFGQHFDEFKCIFDAACIGQYMGGIDPRNAEKEGKNTVGFVNPDSDFKALDLGIGWTVENNLKIPVSRRGEDKVATKIINLHIHSKNLEVWASDF